MTNPVQLDQGNYSLDLLDAILFSILRMMRSRIEREARVFSYFINSKVREYNCILWIIFIINFLYHTNPLLDTTWWIDVCQSNENLLASGGKDKNVKVFDKRESKIVQTFDGIHSSIEVFLKF